VEAALAQVGMARARQRDRGFVAGDDGGQQHLAVGTAAMSNGQRRRHHDATAMRGAVAIAVVELDAVRSRAAQEGSVEQVGAARTTRHRH
jgi:hypothetical protein